MMFGPQAAFLPELFGTKVRYSGASLGCQVSAAISGGFAPLIATALLAWENGTHSISLYKSSRPTAADPPGWHRAGPADAGWYLVRPEAGPLHD
jgi:hypothetical protein